jgi:hypothetical protein
MPAVNGVGKPCEGEPHARIDGRELETERTSATATEKNNPTGNRAVTTGSSTYRRSTPPRQFSTLHGAVGFGGSSCCGRVWLGNRGVVRVVGRLSRRRAGSESPWLSGRGQGFSRARGLRGAG